MGRHGERIDYYRQQYFSASLRGAEVAFVSKPGLPGWDGVTPASALLAESVEASSDARMLLLGCGHGALGVTLARLAPQGSVLLSDISVVALAMAEETLRHNQLANAAVQPDPTAPPAPESQDVVVLELPKGRALIRRWLVHAYVALAAGGRLYLAGAGDEGVEPAIADARELFGGAVVLAYKKGNRVAVATKRAEAPAPPAWATEPGIAPGSWHALQVALPTQRLELKSLPGIFAYDRLDDGTAFLLQALPPLVGARALDLGCGYGVLGLALAAGGATHVDLVDSNLLAVASARANIADLGLKNATAFASDALASVGGPYDAIVSNPPFHSGKAVSFDVTETFIVGSRQRLRPGGSLIIVANSFIRYDRVMGEVFGNVEPLASNKKFQVLRAERS